MTESTTAPSQAPAPPAGEPPAENLPQAVPHLQNKPAEPETPKPGPPPAKDGDEPLGPAGLKALQEERAARKADAEARKALEDRLKKLEPLERIAAALGEGDPAKGKTEIESLTERLSQHETELREERIARWKLEAISEHKLPAEWADRLRGSTRDELIADAEALAKLLPAKPPSQFQGSGDGGVRDQGMQKPQLTRADLKGMSSAQIEAARKAGQLADLMSGKQ